MLEIKDLNVRIENQLKLKNISITVKSGEMHVLMGPNGSGKSTLSFALMGLPKYTVESGSILLDGKDITEKPAYERANMGMFLSYQNPIEIQSLQFISFLREVLKKRTGQIDDKLVKRIFNKLGLDDAFLSRDVNYNFSGGEKKRAEMAQMLLINPSYAILDEPDTGVDVDSMKYIAGAINEVAGRGTGIILITHYARILKEIGTDFFVHILVNGEIKAEGGPELAGHIEKHGFGDKK